LIGNVSSCFQRSESGSKMSTLKSLLVSRKFWLMVLGILVPVLNAKLDLQMDSVELAGALAVIFANILGIAIEDAAEKSSGQQEKEET